MRKYFMKLSTSLSLKKTILEDKSWNGDSKGETLIYLSDRIINFLSPLIITKISGFQMMVDMYTSASSPIKKSIEIFQNSRIIRFHAKYFDLNSSFDSSFIAHELLIASRLQFGIKPSQILHV